MSDSKKPKQGGGSQKKKGPTHIASPRQNEVPEQIPENLAFLWSVDAVEPSYGDSEPCIRPASKKEDNHSCHYWFPPNKKKYFKKTKGGLYRWKMGNSTKITNDIPLHKLERHSVVSVFFQERQDNFLVTEIDCTLEDVEGADVGWCQIRFHHHEGGLSEAGAAASYDGLGAPALGSSWMPQVLPEVYNYHMKDPKIHKEPVRTGGLCGNLSILIGIAAFSAPVDKAEEAIMHSFKLGKWDRHNLAKDGDCRLSNRPFAYPYFT
jgi:hypothetical protein